MDPSPRDWEGLLSLSPASVPFSTLQLLVFAFSASSARLTHRQWAFLIFILLWQDLCKVGRWGVPNPTPLECRVRTVFLWWRPTARLTWGITLQSLVNSGHLLGSCLGWRIRGCERAVGPLPGSWSLHQPLVSHQQDAENKHVSSFSKFLIGAALIYNGGVSFRRTAKWFNYTYTYIYSLSDSFPIQVITECWAEFPVLTVGPC